jgi:hypothetical protein
MVIIGLAQVNNVRSSWCTTITAMLLAYSFPALERLGYSVKTLLGGLEEPRLVRCANTRVDG